MKKALLVFLIFLLSTLTIVAQEDNLSDYDRLMSGEIISLDWGEPFDFDTPYSEMGGSYQLVWDFVQDNTEEGSNREFIFAMVIITIGDQFENIISDHQGLNANQIWWIPQTNTLMVTIKGDPYRFMGGGTDEIQIISEEGITTGMQYRGNTDPETDINWDIELLVTLPPF